jgi:hypothetical protein
MYTTEGGRHGPTKGTRATGDTNEGSTILMQLHNVIWKFRVLYYILKENTFSLKYQTLGDNLKVKNWMFSLRNMVESLLLPSMNFKPLGGGGGRKEHKVFK